MSQVIDAFMGENFYLSNFYPLKVEFEGLVYPANEHAFQAAKTLDQNLRRNFVDATSPKQAKAMGRAVHLRSDWEQVKDGIMKEILRNKFGVHVPVLRRRFLETDGMQLIEGNLWHDNVWGNCWCNSFGGKAPFGTKPGCRKEGENRLGKLLMEVRTEMLSLAKAA